MGLRAEGLDQLRPVYRSLDASIARAAWESSARFAEVLPVFNPSCSTRAQRARLCALTYLLERGSAPTDAGYRALADAFMRASGYTQTPKEPLQHAPRR